jgi:two-component system, sensor histidine kinase RegB
MRVSLTDREVLLAPDLRLAGDTAPALAAPWLIRLRYGLIAGLICLVLLVAFGAHVPLPLVWLSLPIAAMLLSNLLLPPLIMRLGSRNALGATLLLDVLALTGLLSLTGGPANPLTLLYLVQITLSAVVLSRVWTWSLGGLAILGFGFLFPFHIPLLALEGHHPAQGFAVHLYGMWIAFVAAALLITFFIGEVSEAMRRHERQSRELQMKLARHEKLIAVGTLAAGAAHEMGTPLSTVAIVAKDLERYAQMIAHDPGLAADAATIRAEVDRCAKILHAMSAQGPEFAGESPSKVNVRSIFDELILSIAPPSREVIRTLVPEELEAVLPVETTRQVLAALVKNALDASEPGQPVELSARSQDGRVCFAVRDHGQGMTSETLARLGEPFFTTKQPGRGMGLGTFLARVFAENMHGSLVFESSAGQGTTAILELPIAFGR